MKLFWHIGWTELAQEYFFVEHQSQFATFQMFCHRFKRADGDLIGNLWIDIEAFSRTQSRGVQLRVFCSIVSNGLGKSAKMTRVTSPFFMALTMSSFSFRRIVVIEWPFLNPDCCWFWIFSPSIISVCCWRMTCSKTFESIGKMLIGRYSKMDCGFLIMAHSAV